MCLATLKVAKKNKKVDKQSDGSRIRLLKKLRFSLTALCVISMKLKGVRKAVQKAKCEKAKRKSVHELLKHPVDGAMGPSVDTLRARFHALPERRPQEVETIETLRTKWVDTEGLVERTVPSRN